MTVANYEPSILWVALFLWLYGKYLGEEVAEKLYKKKEENNHKDWTEEVYEKKIEYYKQKLKDML